MAILLQRFKVEQNADLPLSGLAPVSAEVD